MMDGYLSLPIPYRDGRVEPKLGAGGEPARPFFDVEQCRCSSVELIQLKLFGTIRERVKGSR